MTAQPSEDSDLRLELLALPEWRKLLRHFELGHGFAFIILLVRSGSVARLCRSELDSWLLARNRSRLCALTIEEPEELSNLTERLFTVLPPDGPIWVEGAGTPTFYEQAWTRCAVKLNRARDAIATRFSTPLILVGEPWVREVLRDTAPDLWSVRAFTAEISIERRLVPWPQPAATDKTTEEQFSFDKDLAFRAIADLRGMPGRERQISSLLSRAAGGLAKSGRSDEALQLARKAIELGELILREQPRRTDDLRVLSVLYSQMGDLQSSLGEREVARQLYEKAIEIAEWLTAQEPGRADYLRLLSTSYIQMGDLQMLLREGEAARKSYEKSLAIAEQLAAQETGRADYLLDLSALYGKMGDLQRSFGDVEAARQFYEKGLGIVERLAAQELGRADYLRERSSFYRKMGDLQRSCGEGKAARWFYQKALIIDELLTLQEPRRADYLHDLSVFYNQMGDLQRSLGDVEAARQSYEKGLAIVERLVEQEPGRADYQIDLAQSLARSEDLNKIERGLKILLDLQGTNRLSKSDETLIETARERLHAARG